MPFRDPLLALRLLSRLLARDAEEWIFDKAREYRMAHPAGVEPAAFASGGRRSIQLS